MGGAHGADDVLGTFRRGMGRSERYAYSTECGIQVTERRLDIADDDVALELRRGGLTSPIDHTFLEVRVDWDAARRFGLPSRDDAAVSSFLLDLTDERVEDELLYDGRNPDPLLVWHIPDEPSQTALDIAAAVWARESEVTYHLADRVATLPLAVQDDLARVSPSRRPGHGWGWDVTLADLEGEVDLETIMRRHVMRRDDREGYDYLSSERWLAAAPEREPLVLGRLDMGAGQLGSEGTVVYGHRVVSAYPSASYGGGYVVSTFEYPPGPLTAMDLRADSHLSGEVREASTLQEAVAETGWDGASPVYVISARAADAGSLSSLAERLGLARGIASVRDRIARCEVLSRIESPDALDIDVDQRVADDVGLDAISTTHGRTKDR